MASDPRRSVLSRLNGNGPATWVPACLEILGLSTLFTLPVLAVAALLYRRDAAPVVVQLVVLAAFVVGVGTFVTNVRWQARTCAAVWCIPRGFLVRRASTSREQASPIERVRWKEIGHVALNTQHDLVLGMELQPKKIRVRLSPLAAEDDFRVLLEHFEEHAPEHLISIDELGERRYSRPWSVDELLGLPPIENITARVVHDRPRRVVIEAAGSRWLYHEANGILLRDGDEQGQLRMLGRRRLVLVPGTIVATARRMGEGVIEFEFGSGDVLRADLGRGIVRHDPKGRDPMQRDPMQREDASAGTIHSDGTVWRASFSIAVAPVLALAAVLAAVSRAGRIG